MRRYAEREGFETLGELARLDPRKLLGERNIGRRTIAQVRGLIEERLNASWDDLAAAARGPSRPSITRWDELRAVIPRGLRETPLDELRLPRRVRSYAARAKLRTVGDLAARSTAELVAARNFGRASIRRLFEAVRDHMARAPEREGLAGIGLLGAWKTLLTELDERLRSVVIARSGLGGRVQPLEEVAGRLGIRYATNARKVEARALAELRRERVCLAAIRERAVAGLPAGAAPLSVLARDPWWSGIAVVPQALDYFGRNLLDGAVRVVTIDGALHCARCTPEALESAWSALRAGAAEVALPAPLARFRALLAPWEPRIGAVPAEALLQRLRRDHLVEDAGGTGAVLAFGATRRHALGPAMLALLRAAPAPLHTREIEARLGGWSRRSDLLYFGRGLAGVERHFPDFSAWKKRLVPRVIRVMQGAPPDRRWHARELRAELVRQLPLPEWLTFWHLGSLLRRSARVRFAGLWTFWLRPAREGHTAAAPRAS